jgi:hypothetical protein
MQDLIRKLPGVVSTRVGYTDENPASYKSPCRDVSPNLGANDELLLYRYAKTARTLSRLVWRKRI